MCAIPDQDGLRPSVLDISLLGNGREIATVQTGEQNSWLYCFDDLPRYSAGSEIFYSLSAAPVPGYEFILYEQDLTGVHEKNDSSIARKISGSVVWDDADNADRIRPKKVGITLYANGEAVQETTAKAKKDWAFAFKKLPKYDETDQKILYSVKQESIMRLYAVYPSEKERNYKKRPTFSLKVDPS